MATEAVIAFIFISSTLSIILTTLYYATKMKDREDYFKKLVVIAHINGYAEAKGISVQRAIEEVNQKETENE